MFDERSPRCRRCSTLDVACGTGYLTRYLPGRSDRPRPKRRDARGGQCPTAGCRLRPVRMRFRCRSSDGTFERVFTSHFYGHLEEHERVRFLAEARRVAPELVVVDAALREDRRPARVAGASPERRLALAASSSATSSRMSSQPSSAAARSCSPAAGSSPFGRDGPEELVPLACARSSVTTRAAGRAWKPGTHSSRGRSARHTPASGRTSSARRRGSSKARSGCRGAVAPGRGSAAGSGSRGTSCTRPSTARPSLVAIPGARRRAAATGHRPRASRSCASSGATGSSSCCGRS